MIRLAVEVVFVSVLILGLVWLLHGAFVALDAYQNLLDIQAVAEGRA